MTELERTLAAAAFTANDSPGEASVALAEILQTYRLTREANWRMLLTGPLESAVNGLTTKHDPCALEESQGRWVKALVDRFATLFPEVYEEVRLCGTQSGFAVIIETLATTDMPSAMWQAAGLIQAGRREELRRRFADPGHELVRPYRPRPKRDTSWVV